MLWMLYRMNKNRGYTLLELMVVISIILIISSLGLKIKNSIDKVMNEARMESSISDICNILSYGKYYCKVNSIEGAIEINKDIGQIVLYEDVKGGKVIKKSALSRGVSFVSSFKFKVTSTGNLQAGTIYIKDKYGKVSRITISVGVDTVNIY